MFPTQFFVSILLLSDFSKLTITQFRPPQSANFWHFYHVVTWVCLVRVGVCYILESVHASIDLLRFCVGVGSLFMTFFQNFFNSGRYWSYFDRTMAHFLTFFGQFDNNNLILVNPGSTRVNQGRPDTLNRTRVVIFICIFSWVYR